MQTQEDKCSLSNIDTSGQSGIEGNQFLGAEAGKHLCCSEFCKKLFSIHFDGNPGYFRTTQKCCHPGNYAKQHGLKILNVDCFNVNLAQLMLCPLTHQVTLHLSSTLYQIIDIHIRFTLVNHLLFYFTPPTSTTPNRTIAKSLTRFILAIGIHNTPPFQDLNTFAKQHECNYLKQLRAEQKCLIIKLINLKTKKKNKIKLK